MSNRRFRRMQERMMAKPKFVEALRRFNDLPTNEELQKYLDAKVAYEQTQPTRLGQPINPSEEMIKEYTVYKEEQFDNNIKEYYKIK